MATISQIAAELGLSKLTVSRALRGVDGISAETIAQVTAAAGRLGCIPSVAAGLSTGRNHAIGVVVPSLNRCGRGGGAAPPAPRQRTELSFFQAG